jgi:hypothetical protein
MEHDEDQWTGIHLFITPEPENATRIHAPGFDAMALERWLSHAARYVERVMMPPSDGKFPTDRPEGVPPGSRGIHLYREGDHLVGYAPAFEGPMACEPYLSQAARFMARELSCMRLEERAVERARGLTVARDLPPGFGQGPRRH